MAYYPGPPPTDPKQLGGYVRAELEKIAREITVLDLLQLKIRYVAPDKPREGMIIATDGTTLDLDASGDPGVFAYIGGSWVRLG